MKTICDGCGKRFEESETKATFEAVEVPRGSWQWDRIELVKVVKHWCGKCQVNYGKGE